MMNALTKQEGAQLLERVVIGGDLSKLSTGERMQYYAQVCESVGLNPLTRPFEYITLNGKLTLYARRDATDQLRSLKGISIEIKAREMVGELYAVTAHAKNADGRTDESIGAVSLENLKGDAKANGMMKAETKAKRRVTLSICGLGLLDETEVETIPDARITPNAGAGEGMTAKQKQVVADTAIQVKDYLAEGKDFDAFALCETITELEGKLYLWSQLNSKEKAAIKRMGEAERKSEKGVKGLVDMPNDIPA
jgi:hypothetical protein